MQINYAAEIRHLRKALRSDALTQEERVHLEWAIVVMQDRLQGLPTPQLRVRFIAEQRIYG